MEIKEFAPGLPRKDTVHKIPTVTKPKVFEFGVHHHEAERRGSHFDLRLGDPETGHAHSWAMHDEWPKPGQSTWAIQQPTHTVNYMDWEGTIPKGTYGAGKVSLFDRDKTEIIKADDNHVSFNVYKSSGPEEYSLHRITDNKWILHNKTIHKDKHKLPSSKPKYKEMPIEKAHVKDGNYVLSAKIDDAHNLFYFPKSGDPVKVVSYRPGKKAPGGIIEHTHKVPVFKDGLPTPPNLGGTILRGGLYAINPKTGKATPAHTLAGLLNSDVWKSREKQKEHGELIPVLYDVVRYRGRDMENAPYEQKLKVLKEVEKKLPHVFHLPRMAYTSEEKKKLIDDIKAGKIPETKEGVVAWNLKESEPAIKAKFTKDFDVYVKGFFPGEGKYKGKAVGGFYFSHEPDGEIVGKVGTGLTDTQRYDMFKNPKKYLDMVARIKAQHKYQTGALRGPSFQAWHLDKNPQEKLDIVKLAGVTYELEFLWGSAIS